ncbi:RNA binding protein [Arthrobacter phage Brynnie]|nr:RNA binding protein [Arthrobacter phage Brynnie]
MEIVVLVLAVAVLLAAVWVYRQSARELRSGWRSLDLRWRELNEVADALREVAATPAPSPAEPWAVVVARRVVVNLKSGRALDGVLVRRDGPLLFLKNAVLLEEGNEPAAIDGEAVVQAADIDFIQAL